MSIQNEEMDYLLDPKVKTFLTVCQTKNYTHASEILHITQPAVSQHIAHLEALLHVKLVTFDKRKLQLTDAGVYFRDAMQTLAHDSTLVVARTRQVEHDKAVDVCLGVTLTAGEYMVAPALAQVMKAHPHWNFSVEVYDTQVLLDHLRAGSIDCAIVEGVFDTSCTTFDVFTHESLVCICHPDHPLARGTYDLAQLIEHPLLVREEGSGSRAVLEGALAAHNLSCESFASCTTVGSVGMIKQLVHAQVGISFVYESAVAREFDTGQLARISLCEDIAHDICFIRLPESVHEDFYQECFQALLEAYHECRTKEC